MKKRKPPIVLISIIILMLIGVVIMNSPNTQKKSDDVVQAGRDTDSASKMADAQKDALKKTDLATRKPKMMSPLPEEEARRGRETGPAIQVAKQGTIQNQKPNDNSQIGQWYSDESAAKNTKAITVTSPPK